MRASGPGSATMHQVPAGVAQLAERPSCKRRAELAVTWSIAAIEEKFGMYLARAPTTNAKPTSRVTAPATRLAMWAASPGCGTARRWSELSPRVAQDASGRGPVEAPSVSMVRRRSTVRFRKGFYLPGETLPHDRISTSWGVCGGLKHETQHGGVIAPPSNERSHAVRAQSIQVSFRFYSPSLTSLDLMVWVLTWSRVASSDTAVSMVSFPGGWAERSQPVVDERLGISTRTPRRRIPRPGRGCAASSPARTCARPGRWRSARPP